MNTYAAQIIGMLFEEWSEVTTKEVDLWVEKLNEAFPSFTWSTVYSDSGDYRVGIQSNQPFSVKPEMDWDEARKLSSVIQSMGLSLRNVRDLLLQLNDLFAEQFDWKVIQEGDTYKIITKAIYIVE